jgi:membrane-associated phospholipid phosphatase
LLNCKHSVIKISRNHCTGSFQKGLLKTVLLFCRMMNDTTGRSKHISFFIAYLFVLAPGIFLLLSQGKSKSFLILNAFHTDWLDRFFICYTELGNGLTIVLLSLFFFFVLKKRKLGLTFLVTYAFTGLLAQLIKPLAESPRPLVFFSPEWLPFFIRGVIHTGNSSFPSGHTVSAFAAAAVLALYCRSSVLEVLFLILAVAVGFSRVYLSQHFLIDVLAGSFIGVAGALLCMYWCRNIKEERLVFGKKRPF